MEICYDMPHFVIQEDSTESSMSPLKGAFKCFPIVPLQYNADEVLVKVQ
jgi:hypothetical protein